MFKDDLLNNIDTWTYYEAMQKFTYKAKLNLQRRNAMHLPRVLPMTIIVRIRIVENEVRAVKTVDMMVVSQIVERTVVSLSANSMMKPLVSLWGVGSKVLI